MENTSRSAVALLHVAKTYSEGSSRDSRALRDVSLAIQEGEFAAITGPSGSGKSTLLNIMGCLDVPTSGTVYIHGEPVSHMGEGELSRLRSEKVGFVFQGFNLIPRLTAAQNVALPMLLAGRLSRGAREWRAEALLNDVGVSGKGGSLPGELSGGEQQRVAIARALANGAKILLADEPTGNLDSVSGRQVIDLLEELNARDGVTLVLVTHDEGLAEEAGVRIRIRDGRVEGVARGEAPAIALPELAEGAWGQGAVKDEAIRSG